MFTILKQALNSKVHNLGKTSSRSYFGRFLYAGISVSSSLYAMPCIIKANIVLITLMQNEKNHFNRFQLASMQCPSIGFKSLKSWV